jgi:hypothetical protein
MSEIIHILANYESRLADILRGRLPGYFIIRQHPVMPSSRILGSGRILLIDLGNPPREAHSDDVLSLSIGREVWLVYGDGQVSAHWLEAVHHNNVFLSYCGEERTQRGVQSLITSLLHRLAGPDSEEITRLVMAKEPNLKEELVHAVCAHPWLIRRPRNLAATLGRTLGYVKAQVHRFGYQRVEHFITHVRWVGFRQLLEVRGLPQQSAQYLMGIADKSNLRKQLRRATTRRND